MYMYFESPHIRAEILNNDLDKRMQWANKWITEFNERKTELMNITRNKNHQFQSLNFGRTVLEDTHSHKQLGIIFQNNCKWESHIKTLTGERKETSEHYILHCPVLRTHATRV